jgi:hypothetical protein
MKIASHSMATQATIMSILKSANQQPELAGELISKTVDSMLASQALQTPSQPVPPLLSQPGTGSLIDTFA